MSKEESQSYNSVTLKELVRDMIFVREKGEDLDNAVTQIYCEVKHKDLMSILNSENSERIYKVRADKYILPDSTITLKIVLEEEKN